MALHKEASGQDNIHVPYAFEFADATDRAAGTGYTLTPDDVGKLARQQDDDTLWMLTDDSPITWEAVGGGGGGGDSTHSSDYASRPAASNAGDLYLPTDGYQIERDDGSNWDPWGPLYPLTPPVNGDFSWVNQTSGSVTATVSTTKGGIYLESALTQTGLHGRMRVKSVPSTPYTVTIGFLLGFDPYSANAGARIIEAGLCFRASGSGKLHAWVVSYSKDSGAGYIGSRKWTDHATHSADYLLHQTHFFYTMFRGLFFLRIADDGSNRICSISSDGQNFFAVDVQTTGDFLTPDQVGIYMRNDSSSAVSLPKGLAGMTVLHWKEA